MRAVGSVEDDRREPESDLTLLCLRLAEGFRPDEYEHPVAAAVAVAARGITGLGQMKFAERFGRSEADVDAAETGAVAFIALSAEVGALLEASLGTSPSISSNYPYVIYQYISATVPLGTRRLWSFSCC